MRTAPPGAKTAGLWVLGAVAVIAVGVPSYRAIRQATPVNAAAAATGTLTVRTRVDGLNVSIDGVARGKTPLTLSLPLGNHTLEIPNGSSTRSIPITIERGTTLSQYVDVEPATAAASTGDLDVASDQAGAEVRVDGVLKGRTPLVIKTLAPGKHTVTVGSGDGALDRTVTITAGATASLVASTRRDAAAQTAATSAGWVTFSSPIELQVFEDGRLLGTTGVERLMLPSGMHRFDLVSSQLEFRTTTTVQVAAGRVASAPVPLPNGTLSVNALPWADVTIDGRPIGTTPLANITLPIGSHEVVWQHPQLGERRQNVSVSAKTPARIGVDFTK
jgi:serine/threonine-protein kinase